MRFKVILLSKTGYLKEYNTFSKAKTKTKYHINYILKL